MTTFHAPMRRRIVVALLVGGAVCPVVSARSAASPWPDTVLARTQALALLQSFNAELLSHSSATLTLERWCAEHALSAEARIVAQRDIGVAKPLRDDERALLAIDAEEPVRYRRVRLTCGPHVLSQADNWYVPSRLTPAMNQLLDTTDMPFGKVVQPLHFRRQTLSAELLWMPLPHGWEMHRPVGGTKRGELTIPPEVLRHHAVLYRSDNVPFSLVVETYTSDIFDFPSLAPIVHGAADLTMERIFPELPPSAAPQVPPSSSGNKVGVSALSNCAGRALVNL